MKYLTWVGVFFIFVILLDEAAYYYWRGFNRGHMYSHIKTKDSLQPWAYERVDRRYENINRQANGYRPGGVYNNATW